MFLEPFFSQNNSNVVLELFFLHVFDNFMICSLYEFKVTKSKIHKPIA